MDGRGRVSDLTCLARHTAYIAVMAERFVLISFTSPTMSIERTVAVASATAVLAKYVPSRELDDALAFLEMERMAEGYYKGSNWSATFRVAAPPDLADDAGDSTSPG